jgi:SNF2 family DNA or RNA helicase
MTDDKTMNSTAWVKSTMDSLEIPPDHVSDTLSAPPTLPKPLPKGSRLPNHFDTVKDFITETDEKAEERQGTPEHTVHDIIEPYMDELDQLLLEPDMTTERAHFLVSAYANIKRTIDQPFHEKMSTHGLAIAADEQLKARLHPQKQLHPFQQDSVGRMKHLEQTIGGAMLCDDMGLGKTLQIIALIVANPVKTTLVVVPPTIIEQWQKALDENVTGLRTFSYYREGRTSTFDDGYQSSRKTSLEIADYDVVLTSYNILSMEYVAHVDFQERMSKLREGVSAASPARGMCALFDVPWGRMVLDEAHRIRNTDTVLHKSACLLTAEYRIFCTGTPFQNTYASVYAAFKFLRLHPWNNKSTFENVGHLTPPTLVNTHSDPAI